MAFTNWHDTTKENKEYPKWIFKTISDSEIWKKVKAETNKIILTKTVLIFLQFKTTQIYILISPVDVFWDPFITFKQVKLLSFFFHDNNQSNSINYYMRANFQSNLSPQKLYRPTIQQQQRDGLFVITRFFSTLLPLCSHNIQRNESSSDFKNQH